MATKKDLKSWRDVWNYAEQRAHRSMKRKDPIAWAYWVETQRFAAKFAVSYKSPNSWLMGAYDCVVQAKLAIGRGVFMEGALWYSRAKWFVIIARANGFVMNPKKTGVNLKWLESQIKGRKLAASFG